MRSMVLPLTLGLVALALSGCAATGKKDFSCSGLPGNVTCLDSMTVYELTSDPALKAALQAEVQRRVENGEDMIDTQQVIRELIAKRGNATKSAETSLMAPISQPMPVLEPARVVRIWIAPWIDQKGDLHMPGYLFSEITPRRWSFGEAEVSGATVLTPLQVQRDTAETVRPAGTTPATGRPPEPKPR